MNGHRRYEAYEFQQIYGLEVVVYPDQSTQSTSRLRRYDLSYPERKFDAIINDIEACVKRKQPVLVGTISIETSEYLSDLLKKRQITHQVLTPNT